MRKRGKEEGKVERGTWHLEGWTITIFGQPMVLSLLATTTKHTKLIYSCQHSVSRKTRDWPVSSLLLVRHRGCWTFSLSWQSFRCWGCCRCCRWAAWSSSHQSFTI